MVLPKYRKAVASSLSCTTVWRWLSSVQCCLKRWHDSPSLFVPQTKEKHKRTSQRLFEAKFCRKRPLDKYKKTGFNLNIFVVSFCFSELYKKMVPIIGSFYLLRLKFDLIMNSWPQLPQPRYLREQEILQMSHNLHSWKRECSSICLGNFFTFSERSLYHLLRIFRFPSLVCKISGLTVKDTE